MSQTLIALRHENGLSQEQAAKRAGVSQATVSRLERGARMNPRTIVRLLDALGASVPRRAAVFAEIGAATVPPGQGVPAVHDEATAA
ncbi:MAG: helix-turn-helix transcriptional regulator [Deltaproteobacteria bacterium]|nr:helix-turn-helix transcriptional regulator [Deltaproteobacteria bacterium]